MSTTFLLNYQTHDDSWGVYRSLKNVELNASVRSLALEVAREALDKGIHMWTPELDADTPIQIYVANNTIIDARSGFRESGFGIKYALDSRGALVVLNDTDALRHDWKISEIQELVGLGYVKGDPAQIIVALPEGLGSDGLDIFNMVGFLSASLQLIDYGYQVVKHFSSLTNKEVKNIADQWSSNGIRYPYQLREFIDTKSEWRTPEVCLRLKLNEEQAYRLLTSLGLELKGSAWKLTQSKESVGTRKRWLRNEKRYLNVNDICP